MTLFSAPTEPFKTTLDGSVSTTDTTIALVSTTGLVAPGVIVLDRQDGLGIDTFGNMEFCSFTGISGRSITGVSRALGGSVAKKHNSGALVECFLDISHWNGLINFLITEHELTGPVNVLSHAKSFTVTGVSGLTGLVGDILLSPQGSVTLYPISGASGYSYLSINTGAGSGGLTPFLIAGGLTSLVAATPPLIIEENVVLKSVSAVLQNPASGSSLVLDINKNGTSIFTNQSTRLSITGGGTYISTASIGTTSLSPGNIITIDIDNVLIANDLSVTLET